MKLTMASSVFSLSAVLPAKSSLSSSPPNGSRSRSRVVGFKWSRRSTTYVKVGATKAPAEEESSLISSSSYSTDVEYAGQDYVVKKVSAKEVEEMMKGSRSVPLVVDFYATWCGPCILMAQDLEMLAVEYENNVLFVKVDTDEEYEFANDMQVRGLPTLYFISPDSNKDAIRTEGLVPPEMIRNIIDNEM